MYQGKLIKNIKNDLDEDIEDYDVNPILEKLLNSIL